MGDFPPVDTLGAAMERKENKPRLQKMSDLEAAQRVVVVFPGTTHPKLLKTTLVPDSTNVLFFFYKTVRGASMATIGFPDSKRQRRQRFFIIGSEPFTREGFVQTRAFKHTY